MMFLHTRTGDVQPQLSNRVMPGAIEAENQPTIRVRSRPDRASVRLPKPTTGVGW
jgi:hypothetical protein